MPNTIILLTLLAALLHASWNALLRGGSDRLWSMTIMCIAIAIASAISAVFLPAPAPASWFYALISALLHVGYNLCLVRSYRVGDLGQTYPVARGSSPLLVTLGAAVFAGEKVALSTLLGVFLVSGGIIFLAFRGRKPAIPSLPYSLATGCFIAAYSVVDGMGVRQSGAPLSYTVWMCALWGVLMPALYIIVRDAKSLFRWQPGFMTASAGGLISLLAYGIIIYAMSNAPMGAVSALRETSVLFAAVIGYLFLGESLSVKKMLACTLIAIGTVLIG
ncbi:multidrug DMT transporter permease [Brenneria goodwinii]|uniref:Multidrug DMT transporter permease n=1 Tax=Brenneria goodwinii TaxID=1109412 RepID=A0AAE8EPF3_9GAMM|nr:DMT family transporter [Brenneria goodwinii]ATA24557.1 multidrug DMT transporter permease [Brenneria goodwinii]MCG8157698.1 EamA family transporter [Brenneria goodwinii]MCG8161062.1 EamA family transporter [Brenneria goodwinii]MCG8165521.1 EamA family transporter [Brenneria goodwinii]MCG8170004.1 EamA family transporter [Brenneria goodwinii]